MEYGVLRKLTEELEDSMQRHRQAKDRFWEVASRPRELSGAPGAIAHPGEPDALTAAVIEQNLARKAHLDAVVRLNLFLLHGIVPEDLKAAGKTRAANAN